MLKRYQQPLLQVFLSHLNVSDGLVGADYDDGVVCGDVAYDDEGEDDAFNYDLSPLIQLEEEDDENVLC